MKGTTYSDSGYVWVPDRLAYTVSIFAECIRQAVNITLIIRLSGLIDVEAMLKCAGVKCVGNRIIGQIQSRIRPWREIVR